MNTSTKHTLNAIEVPVRIISSHDVATPGFESSSTAHFTYDGHDLGSAAFELRDIELLGVVLQRISIRVRDAEWHLMHVEFKELQSLDAAQDYLRRLCDAFTVSMAPTQRDPWYGNLVMEAGWGGLKDATPKPPGTLNVTDHMKMTVQHGIPLVEAAFLNLHWTPLTEVFADGMRASQPKAKFLYWFVILEELERRDEFRKLFTPLFTYEEKQRLLAASLTPGAKQRVEQLLNQPSATHEGRPTKLLRILQEIGMDEVQTLQAPLRMDETICRSLIKQRNNIAHRGETIDRDQLYVVLFPLAQGALAYLSLCQD